MMNITSLLTISSALCSALVSFNAIQQTQALDVMLDGMNYDLRQGPDWDPNRCKSPAQIKADLKIISTVATKVRTYSLSGCDVATVLTEAKKLGLQVWLGVWVAADEAVYKKEVAALHSLLSANLIDSNVVGMNVGSEAVYREDITADQAIEYLNNFKSILKENGLSIPVSITDIVDVFTSYPDMVQAGDVVTVNQFPFWEKVPAKEAAAQFKDRIQPLLDLAGSKRVIISETGWPTDGSSPAGSIASPEAQATFLNDFYFLAKEMKWEVYYFAAFDTPYKALQTQVETEVESHFGLFTADGTMKPAIASLKMTKPSSAEVVATKKPVTTKAPVKDTSSSSSVAAPASSTSDTSKGTSSTTPAPSSSKAAPLSPPSIIANDVSEEDTASPSPSAATSAPRSPTPSPVVEKSEDATTSSPTTGSEESKKEEAEADADAAGSSSSSSLGTKEANSSMSSSVSASSDSSEDGSDGSSSSTLVTQPKPSMEKQTKGSETSATESPPKAAKQDADSSAMQLQTVGALVAVALAAFCNF